MPETRSLDPMIKQLNRLLQDLRKLSEIGPSAVGELTLRVLESLEGEAQIAVENAYRVLELNILNRIAAEISSAVVLDIQEMLELVHRQVSRLMETRNLYVALYDEGSNIVRFPFIMDRGRRKKETGEWQARQAGKGLTEYVIRTHDPVLWRSEAEKEDWYAQRAPDVERIGAPAISWLGVPMIARGQVIGVIAVQDYIHEDAFDHEDLNVLSTIAGQAAIAITNAQLIQSRDRQLRDLQQLREVGQTITSTIDEPRDVLRKVVQGARTVMDADVVALFPIVDGTVEPPVFETPIIEGARRSHEHEPLPRSDGIAATILKEGVRVFEDLRQYPEIRSRFVETEGVRSFAGIPLRVGGNVEEGEIVGGNAVGVLYFDYREPHHFSDDELNTIHLFAAQAAVAINNTRLYEKAARRLEETQKLAQVGQRVLARSDDPRNVLQEIADQALSVLKADLVILYLYHQASREFDLPTIRAGRLENPDFPEHEFVDENDIAFKIVAGGQPQYAPHTSQHDVLKGIESSGRQRSAQPFVLRERIASSASVPLKVADETVGVLFVNYRSHQAFDEHQRAMIDIFANNAAIAIQNSRLFEQTKRDLDRRIEEFDALAEVDKTITTDNMDTVLGGILAAAMKIVGAPNGNIMIVDDRGQYLEVHAISGHPWPEGIETRLKIGERGISGWVAQRKQSALILDVSDPQWQNIYMRVLSDTRSELATPLLDEKQHLLGVINLESPQLGAFDEEDQRLLEALAGRAVIAIQNQRRFQSETQLRKELESLSEVVRTINSTTDLQRVLDMILEEGLELMDVPTGNIMLYDKVHGDLWMAAHRGVAEEHLGARQALGEGVVGKAAVEKRCYLVDDIDSPNWSDVYRPFIPGMRSELAVPMLVAENELIGILNAESPIPGDFDARDQRLLKHLADHAVIAIRNAEQFQRLEALREIDRAIISAQDIASVFELIMDYALQLTRAEIGELRLVDMRTGELAVVARRPITGVPVDEASERIPKGKGILGSCIEHREEVVIPDTSKDSRYIPYFQGMKSEVAVPLLQDNIAVGVLSLESPRTNTFDQQDVDWLKALAGQAVVAMQNIERLEQARANSELLADLHQAGQELGRISDIAQLQEAYDIVLRVASAHTKTHRPVIRRYDPTTQTLVVVNPPPPFSAPLAERMSIEEGASGQAFRELRTIAVPDVASPPAGMQAKPSDPLVRSVIMTPVHFKDHKYGTLGLSYLDVHDYVETDVRFIEGLAQQLAITIHRLEAAEARRIAEQKAVAAETMDAMGHSAFELAHRLGNDLGTVPAKAEIIQDELYLIGVQSQTVSDELGKIVSYVKGVLDLSAELKMAFRDFKAEDSRVPSALPVRMLLEEAVDAVRMPDTIQVKYDIPDDCAFVRADHRQVADILRNLLINAIEAMRNKGTITLSAHQTNGFTAIQVKDTGPGIPAELQPRIFDLFVTTKESFGFGLWSARRYALVNGGDLTVHSEPPKGATFTLSLPQSEMVSEIEHEQ